MILLIFYSVRLFLTNLLFYSVTQIIMLHVYNQLVTEITSIILLRLMIW